MGKFDSVITAVEVKHTKLKELIKLYYKKKLALFTWGAPGIGKSETVRQAAQELAKELKLEYSENIKDLNDEKKFMVIDIRLSQCDPSDLRGIPVWDKEKGATIWLPPDTFQRTGYGIIFFDELPNAPPLTQASAYQIILDRKLGTYQVPDGYMLMGAGNRLEDKTGIFEMVTALKNRFGHTQLAKPTIEEWTKYAVQKGVDMRVIAFLNWKRTGLFMWDSTVKENAFATPRSWVHLGLLIKDIPSKDLENLRIITATQVGVGLSGEFAQFIKIKDQLKDISYYMKDPEKCELPDEAKQADLSWAFMVSLVEYYASKQETKVLGDIITILNRLQEEHGFFTLKMLMTVDKNLGVKLMKVGNKATALANKLFEYFD